MANPGSGASEIGIEEEAPRVRQIQGVPTGPTGMVAVTERGPVGEVTLCTSFEEYVDKFGGDVANGDGSHGARGYFAEGGQELYVVRTVHYADVDDPTTKTSAAATIQLETGATAPTSGTVLGSNVGPFALANGDTLVLTVDGDVTPPTGTATVAAIAASRECANAETYALSNGQTLTVAIDGGTAQTIAFLTAEFVAIGAATAEEVAAVINAKITGAHATVTSGGTKVTITSDTKGTDSIVDVTGGTANSALGFVTGPTSTTASNVADVSAVTAAEIKTMVELAVAGVTVTTPGGKVRITSNTTGTSSSVLVDASSTADDELGLDNATHSGTTGAAEPTLQFDAEDGEYGNEITFKVEDSTSGVASEFDLSVLRSGVLVKKIPNLSMDETAARYVETIFNAETMSPLGLTATDLGISGTATQKRPANVTSPAMTGGDDGLTSLADVDFVGSSAGKTGLYGLDPAEDVRLLIVPGRATSAVQNGMISYCEVWREMSVFPILDPPEGLTAQEMVDYVEVTASLLGSSEFGAIYWPRVKVSNPDTELFGSDAQIVVPPSGIIAGIYNRTDRARQGGVYDPPAGVERGIMRTVLGFETEETKDKRKRDLVFPKRINPLTTGRGKPRYIDGSRTLKAGGNFPSVSERRGAIYIEQSIKGGLDFVRHSNNTPELRRTADRSARAFLITQMNVGAFKSRDPATAFFTDFGDGLNTDAVIAVNQMIGRIGLALNQPAEFVVLRFSKDTRALEESLAT